jgi:uncharacterized protein (TIGR02453 family)
MAAAAPFPGFSKDFFRFFTELAAHNDRDWFERNKARYRETVVEPAMQFITAMAPRLAKISRQIVADPRPNGGSMFRIHRDIRFSKDKSPYKDHAGIQFRHVAAKTAHAPGFYVHLSPKEIFFGGGVWMPEPDALARIRKAIAAQPAAWRKATGGPAFAKLFGEVRGDALARPPKGFDPEHPLIEVLKKKSFFAMREARPADTQGRDFIDEVEATFRAASPLMKLLCGAVGAKY